jgi:hypothetical protein
MKLKKLLSEIGVEQMKVYSNPYVNAFKPMEEDVEISKDDMEKLHSDGEVEVDGEKVTFEEGKKRFKRQDGIGKAKYTISYHDGKKKHKDGSDFFDIKIFKNKKDLSDFVGSLVKQGYVHESVNEADDVYHKSYTHAIEAAEVYARKKGYTIEDDEMFTKVGMNSKRPSVGKTTRVSLELLKNGKPQKKMLHIQVYGMKNGYELNAYIN